MYEENCENVLAYGYRKKKKEFVSGDGWKSIVMMCSSHCQHIQRELNHCSPVLVDLIHHFKRQTHPSKK